MAKKKKKARDPVLRWSVTINLVDNKLEDVERIGGYCVATKREAVKIARDLCHRDDVGMRKK